MTRYSAAMEFPSQPKYQLGQQVDWTFISDDTLDPEWYGRIFREEGIVLGYWWNQPTECWCYVVLLTYSESSPKCCGATYEEMFEEEICHAY